MEDVLVTEGSGFGFGDGDGDGFGDGSGYGEPNQILVAPYPEEFDK